MPSGQFANFQMSYLFFGQNKLQIKREQKVHRAGNSHLCVGLHRHSAEAKLDRQPDGILMSCELDCAWDMHRLRAGIRTGRGTQSDP